MLTLILLILLNIKYRVENSILNVVPVSYTHLDVYKRQGIKKTDLSRDEFLKHAWAWTEEHGGIIPVSYTHLDVYKRQE